MASKTLINFVILIASAGSAGAITFQATLNVTGHVSLDVTQIIPLYMSQDCFVKQSNGHNCFAGAAQIMATMCGKAIDQDSCDRNGNPPFKGSITECLQKNGFKGAHEVGVREGSFEEIWNQLEDFQMPVGMGIEKHWTTKKGKRKSAGHAMAVLAAAAAYDKLSAGRVPKVVTSNGVKRKAQFLGVIDPWGRVGVESYDIIDTVDPGLKKSMPRMGIHWIPYERLGGETLSNSFSLPAGWNDAKVGRWVFMGPQDGTCMFNPEKCPKGLPPYAEAEGAPVTGVDDDED